MTQYTMTQIRGSRLESLLCELWDKRCLRVRERSIFLDVNIYLFWVVVDYLNNKKDPISTYSNPESTCL